MTAAAPVRRAIRIMIDGKQAQWWHRTSDMPAYWVEPPARKRPSKRRADNTEAA
jgi:hypothetical protein